jgi:hypothetical protein
MILQSARGLQRRAGRDEEDVLASSGRLAVEAVLRIPVNRNRGGCQRDGTDGTSQRSEDQCRELAIKMVMWVLAYIRSSHPSLSQPSDVGRSTFGEVGSRSLRFLRCSTRASSHRFVPGNSIPLPYALSLGTIVACLRWLCSWAANPATMLPKPTGDDGGALADAIVSLRMYLDRMVHDQPLPAALHHSVLPLRNSKGECAARDSLRPDPVSKCLSSL